MADILTQDGAVASRFKTFSLATPNNLNSTDRSLEHGVYLYGTAYGRPFNPTRVTISYVGYTKVKVFNFGSTSATNAGSVTYYDPNTVTAAKTNTQLFPKSMLPLSAMPSWLSTIVTPNI